MKMRQIVFGYIMKYFLGFCIVFLCSILISDIAQKNVEKYVLELTKIQAEKGVEAIRQDLEKMDLIELMVSSNMAFTKISHYKPDIPKNEVLNLRNVTDQIRNISYLSDCSAYMFSLFRNNNFYVSEFQCSYDFNHYYDDFLTVDLPNGRIRSGDNLKEYLFNMIKEKDRFIKTHSIKCWPDSKEYFYEDAILYLGNGNHLYISPSYLFCFVITQDYLVNNILMHDIVENGYLYIQKISTGEELVSYGNIPDGIMDMDEDSQILHEDNHFSILTIDDRLGWKVTVGFPDTYIKEKMKPVRQILLVYIFIGLTAVLLLTLYFSLKRYSEFRKVVYTFSAGELCTPKNKFYSDYQVIRDNIINLQNRGALYRKQVDTLRHQNQAILLENLMAFGIRTPQEKKVFEGYFDRMPEFYCIVMIRFHLTDTEQFEEIVMAMADFLKRNEIALMANVRSGVFNELFLIELSANQSTNVSSLVKVYERMLVEITTVFDATFHVGISTVGTELENMNRCYEQVCRIIQAQYAFENENVVKAYDIKDNMLVDNPVTPEFLNRIYSIIICGEKDKAWMELDKIKEIYRRMPYRFEANRKQIFYAIQNILYSASIQLGYEWSENIDNELDKTISCEEMVDGFKKKIGELNQFILQGKKSKNEKLQREILNYMTEHFSDAGLSAFTVSKAVGISEKYLYQYLKEQTGETFAAILMRIRIEHAKKYLEESQYSNEKIAELTGFGSANTFYRNFSKYMGITPKVYREKYWK